MADEKFWEINIFWRNLRLNKWLHANYDLWSIENCLHEIKRKKFTWKLKTRRFSIQIQTDIWYNNNNNSSNFDVDECE